MRYVFKYFLGILSHFITILLIETVSLVSTFVILYQILNIYHGNPNPVTHITNLPIKTKQAPKGACLIYHLIDI